MDNLNADVSVAAVHAFFGERDPALVTAIQGMESVETWTQDRVDQVQATLQQLADKVEEYDLRDIQGPQHSKLIILMGYISSGKALKLLMWIEHHEPNFVAKTLAEAQMLSALDKVNEGAARLFVERFETLERMHMLSRVFSEDRLRIVQRVLRILAGEDTGDEEQDEEEARYDDA